MSFAASLRLLHVGFLLHFKAASRNGMDVLGATIWPLVYASLAFFMFRAGGHSEALFNVTIGASVLGSWSIAVSSAGNTLQMQRWLGTLESLVAAPAPFAVTLGTITLALATLGIYSVGATLLWARFLFGIPIDIAHPLLFVATLPFMMGSIGVFGFFLAASCVLYRTAWALTNLFEFPGWLISGLIVPISLLPVWVRPLSWLLAPTWGVRAMRAAASGGPVLPSLGMCAVLSVAYLAAGLVFLRVVLHRARASATFSLT